jgi:hypothetical protein
VAAASTLLLATAPGALAAKSKIGGTISPVRVQPDPSKPAKRLTHDLTVSFEIVKDGEQSATLRRAVVRFPANVVLDGRHFPACEPGPINAGSTFNVCPQGSRLGSGRFVADVPGAGVYNVPGRVTVFNGRGGKSMTVHLYADTPAIATGFTAPLRRVRGRYELTMPFPSALQKLPPAGPASVQAPATDSLLEIKRLTVSLLAVWRDRSYVELTRCPRSGRTQIGAAFDFVGGSSPAQPLGLLTCKRQPRVAA